MRVAQRSSAKGGARAPVLFLCSAVCLCVCFGTVQCGVPVRLFLFVQCVVPVRVVLFAQCDVSPRVVSTVQCDVSARVVMILAAAKCLRLN